MHHFCCAVVKAESCHATQLRSHPPQLFDEPGDAVDLQLAVDGLHVVAYRGGRTPEFCGDLFVGVSLGHEPGHCQLPGREVVGSVARPGVQKQQAALGAAAHDTQAAAEFGLSTGKVLYHHAGECGRLPVRPFGP